MPKQKEPSTPAAQGKSTTLEVKLNVFRHFEQGDRVIDIANSMSFAEFSMCIIRKFKDKIKVRGQSGMPLTATRLQILHSLVTGKTDNLISIWSEDQTHIRIPLSIYSNNSRKRQESL